MIKLAGFEPFLTNQPNQILNESGYIPILFTGLRNGEKLYEELLIDNSPQPTEHTRIMKAIEVSLSLPELTQHLGRLKNACELYDPDTVHDILNELPIGFTSKSYQDFDITSINPPNEMAPKNKK